MDDVKGLFGGAEVNLGHRGMGLEARRLRNSRFRGAFIVADDALEVGGFVVVEVGWLWPWW